MVSALRSSEPGREEKQDGQLEGGGWKYQYTNTRYKYLDCVQSRTNSEERRE